MDCNFIARICLWVSISPLHLNLIFEGSSLTPHPSYYLANLKHSITLKMHYCLPSNAANQTDIPYLLGEFKYHSETPFEAIDPYALRATPITRPMERISPRHKIPYELLHVCPVTKPTAV